MVAGIVAGGVVVITAVIIILVRASRRRESTESELDAQLAPPTEVLPSLRTEADGYLVTEASPLYTEANPDTTFGLHE
jgi:hypothetical protein